MITKTLSDLGLTRFYPVITLHDPDTGYDVIMDRADYSSLRIDEGMSDKDIMNFAGVI